MGLKVKDEFEIKASGHVVNFQESYVSNGMTVYSIKVLLPNEGGVDFATVSYADRWWDVLYEHEPQKLAYTFADFKNHILHTVPEEARRQGVEPFQLSEIGTSDDYDGDEEAVILTIISAGGWDTLRIELCRSVDIDLIRSFRAENQKLREQLAKLSEEKQM